MPTWSPAQTAPPAPSVTFTRSGPAPMAGAVTIEQNVLYAPFLPREADPWVWDFLVSGSPAGPYAFDLPPAPAAGTPVGVRVIVSGLTDGDHAVEAALNGVVVGRAGFDGPVHGRDPGHRAGRVAAGRRQRADPDLHGEHFRSRRRRAGRAGPPGGRSRARPGRPGRRRMRCRPTMRRCPSSATWTTSIVTHELFRPQADAIAALKAAEGHRPLVVDVARAYDRFSAGLFEAAAVKALIRHVRQRSALRYVLLVGDDTFDYRDAMGLGLVSYVPSLTGWDGEFGRVPSREPVRRPRRRRPARGGHRPTARPDRRRGGRDGGQDRAGSRRCWPRRRGRT